MMTTRLTPGTQREFCGVQFCWIPAGSFLMGRTDGEDGYATEDPQHEVSIQQGFWMAKYPLTQGQWKQVMGRNPSYFEGDNRPVEKILWDDIRRREGYLERLNAMHPGNGFRLPSEAEWEYAYRAGGTTRYYWGEDPDHTLISEYAWYRENAHGETHEVGKKQPNAWGLHDMSGNVWEWCEDDWHNSYVGAPTDGSAWVDVPRGVSRVLRGGAWINNYRSCRAARRSSVGLLNSFNLNGFRIVRPMD